MSSTPFQVAFVGVGRMGANMARRLHEQGYAVTAVYDVDTSKTDAVARELGCRPCRQPAQVAECSNTIITVVSDDQAMRTIYQEEQADSLLAVCQNRLFINCATVSPDTHRTIEAAVERHGGRSLEACMASSIPQARQGTLYLMCGGKPHTFEQAKPVLETMSTVVRYIGQAGEASKVKILVNMVMNINTAGLAEGLGLGKALGLDLTTLREVFAQTGAASRVLETDGEDMVKREHDCYFSASHATKDSGLALSLAETVGLQLPLAQATWTQYRRLVDLGKGEWDKSAIAELTFPRRG